MRYSVVPIWILKIRHIILLLINMFVITGVTSCAILPGMRNLDMYDFPIVHKYPALATDPIIIPITPGLLLSSNDAPYIYTIGGQDILNINVWQHPEFDRPSPAVTVSTTLTNQYPGNYNYQINPDGNVYFPLVGYVHVAGKTIDQVRKIISRRLHTYIRNPQVNVSIAEYRSKKIYVLGEVIKPGVIFLNDQCMALIDALTQSGSIDPNTGDPRFIYIIRGNLMQPNIYWLNADTPDMLVLAKGFRLKPDDIIYVSTATVTRWNRFLSQLLPTLQTIWYTKAITGK